MKFIGLFYMFFSAASMANSEIPNGRHISVKGEAEISIEPDIAIIEFQIENIAGSSLDAKKNVDSRVEKLMKGMGEYGVGDGDLTASTLLVEPNIIYAENNKREKSGYIISRSLTATLNDTSKLNQFLDFILSIKIDEINEIKFVSSNERKFEREAVKLAIEDAKLRGEDIAESFQAQLGSVYSVNSSPQRGRFLFESLQRSSSGVVDASRDTYLQEKITFSAKVNVVFDLVVK